jgi:hypothetical protein
VSTLPEILLLDQQDTSTLFERLALELEGTNK